MNRSYSQLNTALSIFVLLMVSVAVAFRGASVGADAIRYMAKFEAIASGFYGATSDLGFIWFVKGLSLIGFSPQAIFATISLVVTSLFLYTFQQFLITKESTRKNPLIETIFFFSFLLVSSWFLNAITNGLRQSVMLLFSYAAMPSLLRRDFVTSFGLLSIGALFHSTGLFAILAALLLLTPARFLAYFWAVSAIFYLVSPGALAQWAEQYFGLPVYTAVAEYGVSEEMRYVGFNGLFFTYTIIWPILFTAVQWLKPALVLPHMRSNLRACSLIFCAFCMPYFWLGFGAWSNRWAYMAWLFLPIYQGVFFAAISIKKDQFLFYVSCFIFSSASIIFMLRFV